MKKFICLIVFFSLFNYSQTDSKDFTLKDFTDNLDGLIGAIVKLKECNKDQCYYAATIYINLDERRRYNGKKRGSTVKEDYTKLRGKQFTIKGFKEDYRGITLELFNSEIGTVFQESSHSFVDELLDIVDIKMPSLSDMYCNDYLDKYDKFEKTRSISTTLNIHKAEEITFIKGINESTNQTSYFVRLSLAASNPIAIEKGVYILFDDGSQIRKPDIIVTTDVSPFNYRDYDLKAFFEIDDQLYEKLSNNKITDVKLFTKSQSFNDKFGEKIRARFNCLVNDTYKLVKRFRN